MPWCVRKCPYCDFNSHPLHEKTLPEETYLAALLRDLDHSATMAQGRPLYSVFIGGGTPSLFAPSSIGQLLEAVARYFSLTDGIEITLEANPGAVEHGHFSGYRDAGVNRLSLGIQSFNNEALAALGRIHCAEEARTAICAAQKSFDNVNLDFMFALPGQDQAMLKGDLDEALAFHTAHLSWYQLTLEPNTAFAHTLPSGLPDEDTASEMQDEIVAQLAKAGYQRYEISAYAQPGKMCLHNLNYWQFGDYLAIGAGAHGKISWADRIERMIRYPHPQQYMKASVSGAFLLSETRQVKRDEIGFEFMLNALRLCDGVPASLFTARTGLPLDIIAKPLALARKRGLIRDDTAQIVATEKGYRFLNETLHYFLDES